MLEGDDEFEQQDLLLQSQKTFVEQEILRHTGGVHGEHVNIRELLARGPPLLPDDDDDEEDEQEGEKDEEEHKREGEDSDAPADVRP